MAISFKSLGVAAGAGLWLVLAGPLLAQSGDGADDKAVAETVEDLKKQVISLNRDLFILEEDLLFPASTQVAVFLSVDAGEFLKLDSVKLKVDGDVVGCLSVYR